MPSTACPTCGRNTEGDDEPTYAVECVPECDRYHSAECNLAAHNEDGPCVCGDGRKLRTDAVPVTK